MVGSYERILDNKISAGFIVTGDDLVMAHPADHTGQIVQISAFFHQHRVSGRQEALDQLQIAAEPQEHAQIRIIGNIISHLIGHDVLVFFIRLYNRADDIQVPGQPQKDNAIARLAGAQ